MNDQLLKTVKKGVSHVFSPSIKLVRQINKILTHFQSFEREKYTCFFFSSLIFQCSQTTYHRRETGHEFLGEAETLFNFLLLLIHANVSWIYWYKHFEHFVDSIVLVTLLDMCELSPLPSYRNTYNFLPSGFRIKAKKIIDVVLGINS